MSLALTLIAAVAVLQGAADDNPLIPRYPFKSVKITYGKATLTTPKKETLELTAVAYASGRRSYCKQTISSGGTLTEQQTRFTDGKSLYTFEREGNAYTSAKKGAHPGAWLRAAVQELTPDERRKFDENRESIWNVYAPVFGVDWVEDKATAKVTGTERVCDRECVAYTVDVGGQMQIRYWRWKGTDLILKYEMKGTTLAAEKIEEDVELPDGLFEPPEEPTADEGGAETAKRIFKRLVGRDAGPLDPKAVASKAAGLAFDGKAIPLARFRFTWTGKSAMDGAEAGALEVTAEQSPWSFNLVAGFKAEKIDELAGKSAEAEVSINGDGVYYASNRVTIKVKSASEKSITFVLSGTWTKQEGDTEGEAKAGEIEITAAP